MKPLPFPQGQRLHERSIKPAAQIATLFLFLVAAPLLTRLPRIVEVNPL